MRSLATTLLCLLMNMKIFMICVGGLYETILFYENVWDSFFLPHLLVAGLPCQIKCHNFLLWHYFCLLWQIACEAILFYRERFFHALQHFIQPYESPGWQEKSIKKTTKLTIKQNFQVFPRIFLHNVTMNNLKCFINLDKVAAWDRLYTHDHGTAAGERWLFVYI